MSPWTMTRWATWPPSICSSVAFATSPIVALRAFIGPSNGGEAFFARVKKAKYARQTYVLLKARSVQSLWEKEEPLLVDWLRSLPKPVRIMTCSDDLAQHVLDACHAAQIHIPSEVAIVGVDNDEFICHLANPPLSSISLNSQALGYRVAQWLDRVMAGEKCSDTVGIGKSTYVVARSSTNILLVEDYEVSDAIRFIREHSDHPLQVDDVAEAIAMSRRTLQKRFAKTLGRSVHSQILRERVNRITEFLVETDLPVIQIARKLNFSSAKQLDQVFTKFQGVTPTIYRIEHCTK